MEQLAIDLTARSLGEMGMQRTLEAERDEWVQSALAAMVTFADGCAEFKTEDFRAWYAHRASQPHDHHVWGAITNMACRAGTIRWTGRFAASVSAKTHGHPVRVWEKA